MILGESPTLGPLGHISVTLTENTRTAVLWDTCLGFIPFLLPLESDAVGMAAGS